MKEYKYKVDFIRSSYQRFYKQRKKEIEKAISGCFRRGDFTLRSDVWTLEKNIAKLAGTKYCASVNSGTDALFLSLLALKIGKGDEVITVSNTFIASIQAIIHAGATPILVDVDDDDEQIDVVQLESAITKKTKAIMPIHYTGAMADMKEIMKIAKKYKLYVIEDACQAVGAKRDSKMAGAWGDIGCYSFNTAKLLGGFSDGGAIVTNNRKLWETICLLRNHWNAHQLSVNRNDYPQPTKMQWAWKSRLGNVNAAFLNVKFKYLKQLLKRRKEIAERYIKGLKERDGYHYLLPARLSWEETGCWQEFHFRAFPDQRQTLVDFLKKKGIETLVRDSTPNHLLPGLKLSQWKLPVTEQLAKEVVRLPLHAEMTNKEVNYIIKCVKEFYDQR